LPLGILAINKKSEKNLTIMNFLKREKKKFKRCHQEEQEKHALKEMRRTTLSSGKVCRLTPQSGIIRSILQLESTKFSNSIIRKIQLISATRKDRY
jgi:hypothetical protein